MDNGYAEYLAKMSSTSDRNAAARSSPSSPKRYYGRKLTTAAKPPAVEIHIDNHYRSKVYTSGSAVTGHISISIPIPSSPQQQQQHNNVKFDSIQILLLGTTRTRVDGVNIPQTTSHTFLKLVMPTVAPAPRVLEPGRAYTVPFHFVIPRHLTLHACAHAVAHDAVRDHHTRLPPTMGTRAGGSWGDRDDLSPDMSRVEYVIKARVLRGTSPSPSPSSTSSSSSSSSLEDADSDDADIDLDSGRRIVRLFEAAQEIRVLPAHAAEPPLSLAPGDKLYAPSRTKTLRARWRRRRRTILFASSKLGAVTASATQPPAAMLSPDGRGGGRTTARVDLRFEPAAAAVADDDDDDDDDCALLLPKVTSVKSKITAVTYYSASGVRCLPNLGDWGRSFGYEGSGSYSNTTSLPSSSSSSSVTAPQVVWEKQQLKRQTTPQESRDSGYGSDNTPSYYHSDLDNKWGGGEVASKRSSSRRFSTKSFGSSSRTAAAATTTPTTAYTASLQVPIQLPLEKRMFLPTFHSCITSRAYVLWLTISLSCGGGSTSSTKLTLGVPLQIGVEAEAEADAEAEAEVEAETEAVVDGAWPDAEPHHHHHHHHHQTEGLPSFETAVREAQEADAHLRPRVMSVPTVQFHRQPQPQQQQQQQQQPPHSMGPCNRLSQHPAMALPGFAALMAGGVGSTARGRGNVYGRSVAVCGT